jgi:hypothetical protein
VNGYPKLQTEVGNLRTEGLIVHDLTNAFQSMDVSVWNDSAHLNPSGKRVIADKIVELISANKKLISPTRATGQISSTPKTAGKLSD